MVAEKKRGEELEPASTAALPWVCGKGGLRSQERAEWRGRSRGCVMMEGTTGTSMQQDIPAENMLMEEREGRTARAGPLRGGGSAQGQVRGQLLGGAW